jgi:hypothetical protein
MERNQLVNLRTELIREIVSRDTYPKFRSDTLSYHSGQLRKLLKDVLNQNAYHPNAGRDLARIVVGAFELGQAMFISGRMFPSWFPDTGSRFQNTSMINMDLRIGLTPMQLQIRQMRIKLAITPVITMRSDRDTTIEANTVQIARVLVMD